MATAFVGEIRPFPYNFAPVGWAICNGQLMSIAENEVLFVLIGTTYGGDGVNTFALPDLRGRVALHAGQGPGLSPKVIGQEGGEEAVTLTAGQIPSHSHGLEVSTQAATTNVAAGNLLASSAHMVYNPTPNTTTAVVAEAQGHSTFPHTNVQPTLTVTYCISLFGIFPSQN